MCPRNQYLSFYNVFMFETLNIMLGSIILWFNSNFFANTPALSDNIQLQNRNLTKDFVVNWVTSQETWTF